ncbi:DUF2865 domain-containing protein [Methylopila turkensis]|uniref:DUF2865 domain-containing protein n=1 Tax=Methylopila turkensis TaxID=1437816 RepID=A0A9W6N7B5_9HYPH|nr:DUF2865 domain-containing protein [Methylopila turkensis]GLK81084.1 hypothetical protein GCM10008174_28250 [Methylopila turkensis]
MRSRIVAIAAVALALTAATGDALAQQGSDQCLRLEAQLAALERGGARRADPRQIERDANRQQYELDRTKAYARGLGCGRGFLFSSPPPECADVQRRIKQMEVNLDRLMSQSQQASQSGGDPRRRELLFALARNQCGPQYRLVERRVERPQERKGFFEMLFGGGGNAPAQEETIVEPEMDPQSTPRVSTFRTVCVRTCDGFFFPISFQTTRNAFERDEGICEATCPGAEARLYAYPNPGGQMEQATSVDGEPYAKLQNAFRYRKEFVAGCSCKPEGMSWAEALAGVEDKTVKKGDIVVDEQKALEMSRPGSAPGQSPRPNPQARAQRPASAEEAPADAPFATGSQPAAPRVRNRNDVIITDDAPITRGGDVQRRPLDGPSVERAPSGLPED